MVKPLFEGSSYNNAEQAWLALVELARGIVKLADEHNGDDCGYVRVLVDNGRRADSASRKETIAIRMIYLEFELPALLADAALAKAGVLEPSQLEEDQKLRASLIELE